MSSQQTSGRPDSGDDGSSTNQAVDLESQHRSSRGRNSIGRMLHKHESRREGHRHHSGPESPTSNHVDRSNTINSRLSHKSVRRRNRAETTVAYGAEEMGRSTGWAPGLEPGVDYTDPPPYKGDDEDNLDLRHLDQLQEQCEITVVDYSSEQMNSQYLDNENLKDYLTLPQEDWAQVRWINVNGLSWDVIKELGKYKNLHRLAIEDLMNTRNRTKADWYHDHTFVVLPLQRLVNVQEEHDSSSEEEEEELKDDEDDFETQDGLQKYNSNSRGEHERRRQRQAAQHMKKHRGVIASLMKDFMSPRKKKKPKINYPGAALNASKSTDFKRHNIVPAPWVPKNIRTLHHYHAGPNLDRIEYMSRHSPLSKRGLGVSMEQVSIFVTSDNTVISFFEYSAQEVEAPIMRRLQSKSTILRQSCDASMLMQSILDTIIDLAIPVTTAYQDAIGDLELAVLTEPDVQKATDLYIMTSEIAVLRGAIAPVNQLIGALRLHKSTATALTLPARINSPLPLSSTQNRQQFNWERPQMPTSRTQRSEIVSAGVTISELTQTYLGDVEDHAQIIQDSYDQMRRSADNLVDLIFNTVSATQNEAMKQLTIVTCFFLPLTFLVGYFGMNFQEFAGIRHSDVYFWYIAIPVCFIVLLILLREWIVRWFWRNANKLLIQRGRKKRLAKAEAQARK